MKKVLSLVLALTFLFSLMLPALSLADDKTLTLWIFLNPDSDDDARCAVVKKIVDSFNANTQSGYTINVESMNWAKIETAAIQAAAAGTGPDIINFFSDYLKTHIGAETIQPMTEYAVPFIEEMGDYLHTADGLAVNGEVYGLPWENRAYVWWYRSDIFDAVPSSIDELIEVAATKSDAMSLGFAVGLSENSSASTFMETFIPWIHSAGGELLDADGKAIFNSEAGIRVFEALKKAFEAGCFDRSALTMTLDDVQDAFKAGTLLSMDVGTHRASALSKSDLSANFASAAMPGFEEGVPAPALVAGQTLAIGKYCKNPEVAFEFITYFLNYDIQKDFMAVNSMTVRTSLYDDPDVQALSNYEQLKTWNEYASTGTMTVHPEDYAELSVALVKAAQQVVFNGEDAKTQLDEVANWYNATNGF